MPCRSSTSWSPELTKALRVGPQSAGAEPGPAAYGKGGTEPTVTDANVVLGYLPSSLAGGEITLGEYVFFVHDVAILTGTHVWAVVGCSPDPNRDSHRIASMLKRRGYEVILAHDGEAGVQQARSGQPDVILLDMNLPILDGW